MRRYLPHRPFPSYAFAPGVSPHPTRDPRGHSYGGSPEPLETALAWGVDLYNHGYFWEAHEAWEPLWRAAPPKSPRASAIAGLIQCAAACLKARVGATVAARRVGARAVAHLRRAAEAESDRLGMNLAQVADRLAAWIEADELRVDERPPLSL